jgi:hypothetical protein
MNPTTTNPTSIKRKTPRGRAKRKNRPLSAQAYARICSANRSPLKRKGRPAKFPEVGILAKRAEVSYIHAYKVMRGQATSAPLTKMLREIRRELRAKKAASAKISAAVQRAKNVVIG